ncbi:hypothetical protein C1646_668243 [Rhizophagus diaphanus]|nr:hypothetical protein C1646_668243 [Rhizophagus diaphanus] [Rhizophagus sp. MUCL 43196]
MSHNEYLIGTCFSCKKCLYCGAELSIQKKMYSCDKTIKPHTKITELIKIKSKTALKASTSHNVDIELKNNLKNNISIDLDEKSEIMHSDYLVLYKLEKAGGVETQLIDAQDYKKFLSDYKKLLDKKKNIVILVSLKKKKQKRKEISDSEESNDEEISIRKRKNTVPKIKFVILPMLNLINWV